MYSLLLELTLGVAHVCKLFLRTYRLSAEDFRATLQQNEPVPSHLLWQLNCTESSVTDGPTPTGGATSMTDAQVWLNTNLVRLQKAVLCANCEVISEGLNGHCAGCGSQSLLSLNKVLGGTVESEPSFAFATSAHAVSDEVRVCTLSVAA